MVARLSKVSCARKRWVFLIDRDGHGSENVDVLDNNLMEGVDREVALVPLVTPQWHDEP